MVDGVVSDAEGGGAVHPGEGSGLHPGDDVTHNVQELQMTQTAEGGCLDGVYAVPPHPEFSQFDQFVKSSSFHCGYLIVQKLQVHQAVHSSKGSRLNDVYLVTLDVQFDACEQMGKGICCDDRQLAVHDYNPGRISRYITCYVGHISVNLASHKVQ